MQNPLYNFFQKLSNVFTQAKKTAQILDFFSGEVVFILFSLLSGIFPGMQRFHLGSFLQEFFKSHTRSGGNHVRLGMTGNDANVVVHIV